MVDTASRCISFGHLSNPSDFVFLFSIFYGVSTDLHQIYSIIPGLYIVTVSSTQALRSTERHRLIVGPSSFFCIVGQLARFLCRRQSSSDPPGYLCLEISSRSARKRDISSNSCRFMQIYRQTYRSIMRTQTYKQYKSLAVVIALLARLFQKRIYVYRGLFIQYFATIRTGLQICSDL